MSGMW